MAESAPSSSSEVENFLDSLFEGQKGYVYVPTKKLATGYWQPYHFQWPQQREAIVTHILDATERKDVYVAPSLFKAPSDKKAAWKGTNYVWIEFDGNAPKSTPAGIPAPSIRIQSSTTGHEHWYWRLPEFQSDYRVVEGLSQSLTYTLDADKSGWDASQVLRPPGTRHQESKRRVRLISQNDKVHKISDFKNLVEPPSQVVLETNFKDVPDSATVVSKYKWGEEAWDLFNKKKQPTGSRSSAMTRLAFHCIEMGMSNEECYSILYNADERWGKFKSREPAERAKRLIGIISHCRGKKELEAELNLSDRETFVSLGDFLNTDIRVSWLYTDFLAEQGLCVIASAPGVGKTTFSLQCGLSTVLGKDFLLWRNATKKQRRVGFLSLEMSGAECNQFLNNMIKRFNSAEQDVIKDNFFLLPLGYSMNLHDKKYQELIEDEIDRNNLELLIIDSLKTSTGLDEKKMEGFFEWLAKTVRKKYKCTVWIIHHNRKPPNEGPRKPRGLEDLYGDMYITAYPTTVVSLWRRSKTVIEVLPLKVRLAEELDPFVVERAPFQSFLVSGEAPVAEEETTVEEEALPDGSNPFS